MHLSAAFASAFDRFWPSTLMKCDRFNYKASSENVGQTIQHCASNLIPAITRVPLLSLGTDCLPTWSVHISNVSASTIMHFSCSSLGESVSYISFTEQLCIFASENLIVSHVGHRLNNILRVCKMWKLTATLLQKQDVWADRNERKTMFKCLGLKHWVPFMLSSMSSA